MRRYLCLVVLSVLLLGGCGPDEVIRFGAVLPLSGPYEIYGQSIRPFEPLVQVERPERWTVVGIVLGLAERFFEPLL